MRYILYVILSLSVINAVDFDGMTKIIIRNSKDISILEDNIKLAKENILLSSKWDNPTLNMGVNDIWLDDITNRSLEPMQTQYMGLSQVIPTNSKLEIKEEISYKNRDISKLLLKDKILELKSLLYEYLAIRYITQKRVKLVDRYRDNMVSLERLYKGLSKVDSGNHIDAIESGILYSRLTIKRDSLESRLKIIKLQIEKLLYQRVGSISFNPPLPIKIGRLDIDRHPLILSKKMMIDREEININLQNANRVPNVKVSGGYFHRVDREDYISISASIPLNIYGKEDIAVEKSKLLKLKRYDELDIAKNNFMSRVLILKERMRSTLANYKRLKSTIIKDRRYIQKVLNQKVTLNRLDSSVLIKNINRGIEDELLALDELNRYYSAYGKLLYYKVGKR